MSANPPPYQPPYQPPAGYQPYPPAYGPPPGYPFYSPPRPPKPGCVPLRPLGLGDILDGSFQVIRRNPRATLGLSAIVAVVSAGLSALFQLWVNHHTTNTNSTSPGASLGGSSGQLTTGFSVIVVSTFLGAILTGMLAAIVTEDVLGVRVTISQAWRRARPRIWALFGLAVVTTLLEVLGLLPCLVLGVWLWGIWAVAVPALMVEGTTIRGALGRSRQLVAGTFWRVWGIRAIGVLLAAVVGGIVGVPFQLLGFLVGGYHLGDSHLPTTFILLSALGSVLSTTITAPIQAGINALLYVDLRMRKEGLDLVLQQQVGPRP